MKTLIFLLFPLLSFSQEFKTDKFKEFVIESNSRPLLVIRYDEQKCRIDTVIYDTVKLIKYLLDYNQYLNERLEIGQDIMDKLLKTLEDIDGVMFLPKRKRKETIS